MQTGLYLVIAKNTEVSLFAVKPQASDRLPIVIIKNDSKVGFAVSASDAAS
jgi:hypothetical protein